MKRIKLSDGGGGKAMQELLSKVIVKNLKNIKTKDGIGLDSLDDAAVIKFGDENLVFTTDSYTVEPVFFKGGDIGKLSVCGTINDLAVVGAEPLAISSALIISEGFPIGDLERIMKSMNDVSVNENVPIVTGDTKVVESKLGITITTTGVGFAEKIILDSGLKVGDKIIINGTVGDHGIAILSEREGLEFETRLVSDCASIYPLIKELINEGMEIHVAKDPTRGGLANALNEFAEKSKVGVEIEEEKIPIAGGVRAASEMLGIDPLEVANEGKVIIGVPQKDAEKALEIMKKNRLGKDASIIGKVTKENKGRVILNTIIGGKRILEKPLGDPVPRVC